MSAATATLAGTTWAVDAAHSNVEFAVKHMMLATVKGRFAQVAGEVTFGSDDFASAQVKVAVDVASIDTRTQQRDEHLRSPDFFDVANYPELTYEGGRVERTGEDSYRVAGDLTIRGITREVVLHATFEGQGADPWGGTRMAFHATGSLDRREFGLTWNQALETGGILVGDEVKLSIDVELVRN
jgi:polyisoprenoid-binding protein YceI